jgi:hypothetical protein
MTDTNDFQSSRAANQSGAFSLKKSPWLIHRVVHLLAPTERQLEDVFIIDE